MKKIEFYQISPVELSQLINEGVRKQLTDLIVSLRKQETAEYLTREEVVKLLSISYPTLHDWVHKNILKSYKVGNRTYFKRAEVEDSLLPNFEKK